jgi:hypothetical protein
MLVWFCVNVTSKITAPQKHSLPVLQYPNSTIVVVRTFSVVFIWRVAGEHFRYSEGGAKLRLCADYDVGTISLGSLAYYVDQKVSGF